MGIGWRKRRSLGFGSEWKQWLGLWGWLLPIKGTGVPAEGHGLCLAGISRDFSGIGGKG